MQIPHSIETEQAVLVGFLIDKSTWEVIPKLNIDDFYNEHHQKIFQAIKYLNSNNRPIDYIQVYEESKKLGFRDLAYLNKMLTIMPVISNIEHYVEILKQKTIRRALINECHLAIKSVTETDEDARSIKSLLANKLDNIGIETGTDSDVLRDIFLQLVEKIESQKPSESEKYFSGIKNLDYLTTGFHKEEVTVIAARPGVGKTAMALQVAKNIASNKLNVLLVSREMSKEQMAKRFIISKSNIDSKKLRNGTIKDHEWHQIIQVMNEMADLPIFINTSSNTIPEIKSSIRRFKADVLIIDYLQLLTPLSKTNNREQQVSELSREIKNISLDYKIPVILLSQLNRQADLRRPTLADLRESGAIEQDANNVIFLHLPTSIELEKAVKERHITTDFLTRCLNLKRKVVEVIVAKQRDGELGDFFLEYIPDRLTFISLNTRE